SNGIAESFVKTIKRDYISIMPKPDGLTAAKNLAEAFDVTNGAIVIHTQRLKSDPGGNLLS
ncbi:hypothetical protein QR022_24425, partial [Salmonella enterica]|nr:hypothetical protein [Salmonella enterica]MDL3329730.1 hypothetical protein [Salmonella enterica]